MRHAFRFAGISVLVLVLALVLMGCDRNKSSAAMAASGDEIAQKTCPVMEGNKINPKIYVDYEGRRIYFCCQMCPPMFKKDPAKYIAKVDAEIKANQKPADAQTTEPAKK